MNSIAKWAWILLLAILFAGPYVFVLIIVDVVLFLIILWLKPEWIEKL